MNALTSGFMGKGLDPIRAKQTALTMIDGSARLQSSVLAFNDMFFITALLVLFSIPLIFVLGKPAANAPTADAH